MRQIGWEVLEFVRHNADLDARNDLSARGLLTRHKEIVDAFDGVLESFRPDVVYCNNLFPSIPEAVLHHAVDQGVPVVRVIRNYRQECVSANLYRNGATCTECVGKLGIPGIVHRCYRDSAALSLGITLARGAVRRSRRKRPGICYVAVSEYVANTLRAGRAVGERVVVRPNLLWPVPPLGTSSRDSRVVFVGRDDPDKGLPDLLEAIDRLPGARLDVIGANMHRQSNRVRYLGRMSHPATISTISTNTVTVVPSVWPEPFGRVAIESLAVGTRVLVSNRGGLQEFRGPGVFKYDVSVRHALSDQLASALEFPLLRAEQYKIRDSFETHYSPDQWLAGTHVAFELAGVGGFSK